ncbi:MAG TPA: DUF2254 domain-containing protein [Pyrinomonadaceae bacterium]|nr:DUF2254 domain-containing protein [Pyrinomonadaceae bacterium]
MNWRQRYRFQLYVRNSLWILPALSIVAALIAASLLTGYEEAVGSRANISAETARAVMSTVASSTFTLVVLLSSALLLAVQLASAQLTPRIIAMVYRNRYQKAAFALFVFTFTFSTSVLARIETSAPRIASYAAAYGFLLNLGLFIFLIDNVGKMLRPSSAVAVVARSGRTVIRNVYPLPLKEDSTSPAPISAITDEEPRAVLSAADGAVLAFDLNGLVNLAHRHNCLIELVPEVGQWVAAGDPLFRVYHGGRQLTDDMLRNSIAQGSERTPEQDPLFAFRILVDIASKALSPAINDPTTAVLAIDQIHHLLHDLGKRFLGDGREMDRTGQLRLIYRTPNWEDFVQIGTTEIRQYGRDSIQVQRRLRAMLKDLVNTLAPRRAPVLQKELSLLATSSKRTFPDLDDQTLAESGDLQGIGGSYEDQYEPVMSPEPLEMERKPE